jgi:transcriptional regulator with XRE-family HTH domain
MPTPTLGKSLGQVLLAVRKRLGLTLAELGERIGFSAVYISLLERNERTGTFEVVAAYKQAGITAEEIRAIRVWCRSLPEFRPRCEGGCEYHDSEMRPGSRPGPRDESCIHCSSCLDRFLKQWPSDDECHCPPNCSKRQAVPWHVRYYRDGGDRVSGGLGDE